MLKTPNINFTVKNDLCVGCGVCQDTCPQKAISIEVRKGLFRPSVDDSRCNNHKGCHKCFDVCGGVGAEIKSIATETICEDETKEDKYIGRYINHYIGYSTDENIRFHCASGGLTSQFIIYLLDRKIIDGAVVTRFDNNNPLMVRTFIARTPKEVLEAKSSKYAPVTMAGVVDKLKSSEGIYIIVGLPCHIHSFRKLEKKDKQFREKVFAYFGLYCSCGRTFHLTDYTLKNNCISRDQLISFAYRDNGCMGNLHIQYVEKKAFSGVHNIPDKKFIKKLEIPYQKYYLTLRSFFNVHRCLYCIDHFAELSDISFGDIHFGKYAEDKVGINSVVTRKNDLDKLLREAKVEGYITLDEVSKSDLLSSQKYAIVKKHTNPAIIKFYRTLGFKTPRYNETFKTVSMAKAMKSLSVKKVQMFIGSHKSLWWLIKFGCKNMRNWK